MIEGTLTKINNKWHVKHSRQVHTPVGNHDHKVTLEYHTIETHPEHVMWLKMFAEDGLKVCFEVETIAIGDTAFNVMDCDVAKLKACYPDTHEYTQD